MARCRPKKRGGNRNPAADLHDDLLVDILSRLPFKSVCRFKCVSRHWRDGLIANPIYRTKLPQTLTGFFRHNKISSPTDGDRNGNGNGDSDDGYDSSDEWTSVPDFVSIVGRMDAHQVVISPSLSFLPRASYRSIVPKHCSNGLLVCLCWKVSPTNEADYVVCNPVTEKWVVFPGNDHRNRSAMQLHLAVDPASSSGHFHLFAILEDNEDAILQDSEDDDEDNEDDEDGFFIRGVDIYSSETGAWIRKKNGWNYADRLHPVPRSVFVGGMLYLVTQTSTILVVDTEGTICDAISLQENRLDDPAPNVFIGQSQGRLHYVANRSRDYSSKLSAWIQDGKKGSKKQGWICRYSISITRVFRDKFKATAHEYNLVAIHPECNTIFFTVTTRDESVLLSYHMDRKKIRVLSSLPSFADGSWCNPYLPYVPSFRLIANSQGT